MLERNNPALSVDELMEKVQAEVARRHLPRAAWQGATESLPPDAVATVASIEAAINCAEEKAQVRTRWSGRLNRFPFNLSAGMQRFFLKILAFVFKDQRHVNFALIAACRESLALNVRFAEQVDQLRARMNALEDRLQSKNRNGTTPP